MPQPTKILIVDDDPQLRQLLQTGLRGYGYAVEPAADGLAAIAVARDWQPDVIVLDLEMPGLGGLDVCRAVRAWSRVPIIVLTVRDAVQDKIMALDEGADDYLNKPFDHMNLLEWIERLLAENSPALQSAS